MYYVLCIIIIIIYYVQFSVRKMCTIIQYRYIISNTVFEYFGMIGAYIIIILNSSNDSIIILFIIH